jgi:hypothetical protein
MARFRAWNGDLPQKYCFENIDVSEYESKRNTTAWKLTRQNETLFPSQESRPLHICTQTSGPEDVCSEFFALATQTQIVRVQ